MLISLAQYCTVLHAHVILNVIMADFKIEHKNLTFTWFRPYRLTKWLFHENT